MILHVVHAQPLERGLAWCGVQVVGPHIFGVENFFYHAKDPSAGKVCEDCLGAILERLGQAIRRSQERGAAC